jgi:hypothetical protein
MPASQECRETPWIDLARQLVETSGDYPRTAAKTTPPGMEATGASSRQPVAVLILFDEVSTMNRHRSMADSFHAFIQNLTGDHRDDPWGGSGEPATQPWR